ncbi:MAG: DUF2939 domain-containing protein [Pseudomonadota bacterium]|nr:DUF2939 domain-containing protein [Pseudomonadota bacterium]MDQ3160974.1 DUF2939 domain-containing protein [Pseudomonadota bacterium]
MKKWLLVAVLVFAALIAFVVAGPYLAINGIRQALEEQDVAALERHVDFPTLRLNVRAHVEDYIARKGGGLAESGGMLGAIGLQIAGGLGNTAVDTMVTPLGIAALLQGRSMWMRASGDTVNGDTYGDPRPADPLKNAKLRYETASRFTATIPDERGAPVVAVFQRQGLRWRLVDIQLDANRR